MLALLHHALPLVHWLFHHPQGLLLGEGLFSSPGAQAQQAAATTQQYNQQNIAQVEGYANQAATETQNAIAAASPNPYFSAAQMMNPSAYQVNPNNTVTFGAAGPPGTSTGGNFAIPSQQNPFSNGPPSQGMNPFRRTQPVAVSPAAQ